MRWDKLFDDLESQLERELSAEDSDLGVEEERLRLGRLTVRDRLVAIDEAKDRGSDYQIGVTLVTGRRLSLHPVSIGRDWFSADVIDEGRRRSQCIIPLHAVAGITLSHPQVVHSLAGVTGADAHPSLSARLGLTFVLRDLCRRRRAVELTLANSVVHGTVDRVGRDHLDLAAHEAGTVRRESAVTEVRLVPLVALVMVRL